MSKKGSRTTCSAMEWPSFLYLLDRLRKEECYRLYLFAALSGYCGTRAYDTRHYKWKDILNKDSLDLIEHKTKKKRTIYFNTNLKEIIDYVAKKQSAYQNLNSYIFSNRNGTPISIQYLNRSFDRWFTICKISVDNPSTHTFRKTFGAAIWKNDGSSDRALTHLSIIYGHSNQSITRTYLGITEDTIKNVYLSL